MDARTEVLARIRTAQAAAGITPGTPAPGPDRRYRTSTDLAVGSPAALDLLTDRLVDYRARVSRCPQDALPGVLADLLPGGGTVVVPDDLPAPWAEAVRGTGAQVRTDSRDAPLSHTDLDQVDCVITGARLAIAETGVVVLDGAPDQGRRAITLVPDHHICLLRPDQVVATVPEAVAILAEHPERPTTWVAGPSATSDIELVRVEGVHGPRTLDVVLVG